MAASIAQSVDFVARHVAPWNAMRRTKIKTLPLGLLMALGGLTGCNRVGDAYCDTDIAPGDPRYYDVCPYGIATDSKPQFDDAKCPEIPEKQSGDCQNISWCGTIWPRLQQPGGDPLGDGGGSCASGACHQYGNYRGVILTSNAKDAYEFLKNYQGGQPTFYLGNKNSWILCNLTQNHPGGGVTMPPGGALPTATFDLVQTWAQCGQVYETDQEKVNGQDGC